MPQSTFPRAGAGSPSGGDPAHLSILLVEDDDDIREAMAAFLEAEGYDVVQAIDGDDALRKLRASSDRICLVLLDLFMPVKNGWEFRAEQMADPAISAVPVIVVSADRNARDKANTLGALEYLAKPVDFDRLLGTIATYC
ncbi:response regulator [Candidatus Binatia bacterium]|nr:response regulator [Candidatus Binatia bacterium]